MQQAISTISQTTHQGQFTSLKPELTDDLQRMTDAALSLEFVEPTKAGNTPRIFTLSDRKWSKGEPPDLLVKHSQNFVRALRELALVVATDRGEKYNCSNAMNICRTNLKKAAYDWIVDCNQREVFGNDDKTFDRHDIREVFLKSQRLIDSLDEMTLLITKAMRDSSQDKAASIDTGLVRP